MDDEILTQAGELIKFGEAIEEYFKPANSRRRFMKACAALPDFEQKMLLETLAGTDTLQSPVIVDYLAENNGAAQRFLAVLGELDDEMCKTKNKALHRLFVHLAPHEKVKASGYACGYVAANPNISVDLLREFVDMTGQQATHAFCEFGHHLNENLPEDLVATLTIGVADPCLIEEVAAHDQCPEEKLLAFLVDKRWKVRKTVASAPRATDAMLLKLMDDDKFEVRYALQFAVSESKIFLEGLFQSDIEMKKHQIESLLEQAPEYAWVTPGPRNMEHQKLLISLRGGQQAPVSAVQLSTDYLERKTALLSQQEAQLNGIAQRAEKEAEALAVQYEQTPENWCKIVLSEYCSDNLLSKIFINHGNVSNNPVVRGRCRGNSHYPAKLLPRSRKERLRIAETTPYLLVLRALFSKENSKKSKSADHDLLLKIAQNDAADFDLLVRLYGRFGVKAVTRHPACTYELRKAILSGENVSVSDWDGEYNYWFITY